MTVFEDLHRIGQSVWYDNISRELIASGAIASLVAEGAIRGITSNPSIFEKAITSGEAYDDGIRALLHMNPDLDTFTLYEALAIQDIQAGADALRPVYEQSQGEDGYISLEVSPRLAHDTEATVTEARRLHVAVNRPNLMIKVPATDAGLPAVTRLIADGIAVNVTLIFSLEDWRRSFEAYLDGVEQRIAAGGDLGSVASVASFFVSRLDNDLDRRTSEGSPLRGTVAVAYCRLIYSHYRQLLAAPRMSALRERGGRAQRLLWASTGTKNPAYSDLLYVEELVGADTVNTMPPATLDALRDHGRAASRIDLGLAEAEALLATLPASGIDLDGTTRKLKDQGVEAFMTSLDGLLLALDSRRQIAAG
ncbi:MAG: transaldolase [Pseudomonadota bacterium]